MARAARWEGGREKEREREGGRSFGENEDGDEGVARGMKEPARTVPIRSTVPWEGLFRKIPKSIWKDYGRTLEENGRKGERSAGGRGVVAWSTREVACVGGGELR